MSQVSVTLFANTDSLWRSCFELEHEMILTVNGRRIFPTLEYTITGLDPLKMYSMCLHLDLVDEKKLRFTNGQWMESVSTEKKDSPRKVWHHNGAQLGKNWMERRVNFDQIRITNRKSKENGNASYIHLHTQHRYIPVLSIYDGSELVHTARIPHTQFITVTAYHRAQLNALKTNSNPYSTGSRKDRQRQTSPSSDGANSENALSPPPSKKVKKQVQTPLTAVNKEDIASVFPNFMTAVPPNFQMLQSIMLPQTSSIPSPPVAEDVKPAILPTPPADLTKFTPDFRMLQPFLMAPYGFPYAIPASPFLNPLFSPYASMFATPTVSPSDAAAKQDDAENDPIIDVV